MVKTDTLLEVRNLVVRYGGAEALKGVTITAERGVAVSVIGSNGAGKTTMLRAISGLISRTSGEIWFNSNRIDGWPPEAIVRAGISACA